MRSVSTPAIVIGVAVAVAALQLSGGCGTKIVELVVPGAGPGNGESGGAGGGFGGFGGFGGELGGTGGGIGGSSAGTGGSDDAGSNSGQMCTVVPSADTRCVLCSSATSKSMTCLKCDAPVKTSDAGDYCRPCGWDSVMGRCLQCFAADGTATLDDCDALLKAMMLDAGQ